MFDTKLTVIVPAYNEEETIYPLVQRCLSLNLHFKNFEVIIINDGSTDGTKDVLHKISCESSNVNVINLAVNVGHMAALTAGFTHATGEWIATIDADGQDDPMLILEMYEKCIVNSADICFSRRVSRSKDSFVHRFISPLFYKLLTTATKSKAVYQSADFRLISKRVLSSLNNLPEVNRMYRVLIPELGYKSVTIDYERSYRTAGRSKYNFKELLNLGVKSILATTGAPLRWVSFTSFFSAILALSVTSIALIQGLFYNSVPGWASISFFISIMFFLQSISSLVISEFLLVLIADVRQRPSYQLAKKE